jgi:hypothetical protein
MKERSMTRHMNVGLWVTLAVVLAMASSLDAQTAAQTNLGTVAIPRAVRADGKPLPAGSYQVRLTPEEARPAAAGQTPNLERWVELVRGGQVRGREVVTIVPASDMKAIAEGTPPPNGGSKVELLKGGDYLRVWINRGGQHYLIHLPV